VVVYVKCPTKIGKNCGTKTPLISHVHTGEFQSSLLKFVKHQKLKIMSNNVLTGLKDVTTNPAQEHHRIVSAEEWQAARKQLLAAEKEYTHLRNKLTRHNGIQKTPIPVMVAIILLGAVWICFL
jgi:hypothetical protein